MTTEHPKPESVEIVQADWEDAAFQAECICAGDLLPQTHVVAIDSFRRAVARLAHAPADEHLSTAEELPETIIQADQDAFDAFTREGDYPLSVRMALRQRPEPLLEAFARHRVASQHVSTAVDLPAPVAPDAPAIPAGMVPWAGGESAPADWDGGRVLFRGGMIVEARPGVIWKLGWDHIYGGGDVIAYNPTTPAGASQAACEREFQQWARQFTFVGRGARNDAAAGFTAGWDAARRLALPSPANAGEMVMVPRKPTANMEAAGAEHIWQEGYNHEARCGAAFCVWIAMLAAAIRPATTGEGE